MMCQNVPSVRVATTSCWNAFDDMSDCVMAGRYHHLRFREVKLDFEIWPQILSRNPPSDERPLSQTRRSGGRTVLHTAPRRIFVCGHKSQISRWLERFVQSRRSGGTSSLEPAVAPLISKDAVPRDLSRLTATAAGSGRAYILCLGPGAAKD